LNAPGAEIAPPLYPRLQPHGSIGVNYELGDLAGRSNRPTIRSACDALTFGAHLWCQSSRTVPRRVGRSWVGDRGCYRHRRSVGWVRNDAPGY